MDDLDQLASAAANPIRHRPKRRQRGIAGRVVLLVILGSAGYLAWANRTVVVNVFHVVLAAKPQIVPQVGLQPAPQSPASSSEIQPFYESVAKIRDDIEARTNDERIAEDIAAAWGEEHRDLAKDGSKRWFNSTFNALLEYDMRGSTRRIEEDTKQTINQISGADAIKELGKNLKGEYELQAKHEESARTLLDEAKKYLAQGQ